MQSWFFFFNVKVVKGKSQLFYINQWVKIFKLKPLVLYLCLPGYLCIYIMYVIFLPPDSTTILDYKMPQRNYILIGLETNKYFYKLNIPKILKN